MNRLVVAFLGFFVLPAITYGEDAISTQTVCPILEKLVEADELLDTLDLKIINKRFRKNDPKREMGLVIIDSTCRLYPIKVIKDRKKLIVPKEYAVDYEINIVSRLGGTWNYHYTHFNVARPSSASVLKMKWLHADGSSIARAVYNPNLRIPEILERAKSHVRSSVYEAFSNLGDKGVKSLVDPDQVISENTVSRLAIESITFLEQSDPDECRKDCGTAFEMVLVRLGVDMENAFASSKSKKGARGITQFMPGTYRYVLKLAPNAGLIKNFSDATSDHVNILMATIILYEFHTRELIKAFGPAILYDPKLIEYVVAMHNGGPGRVIPTIREAYAKKLPDWTHAKARGKVKGRWRTITIRDETVMFVYKFREFLRLGIL